jgi:hypothetical protein
MLRKTGGHGFATQYRIAIILGAVVVAGYADLAACAEPPRSDVPSPALAPFQPADNKAPTPPSIPAPALAPPFVQSPPPPPVATRWYGYQIMLSDALSVALLFTGAPGAWGGLASYAAAPPIIHVVNGQYGLAVASPLLRLALPVAGAFIGAKMESCTPNEFLCGLGGAVVGLGVGALAAMIVDWSLAWAPESAAPSSPSPAEQHARPARSPRLALTSAGVVPTSDGARLVLGGRF